MKANVQQTNEQRMVPAWIIKGTEAFWFDNEKWLIHEGVAMRFTEAPVRIQNMIANLFLKDEKSKMQLKKMGYTTFSESFDRWYKCIIGALDETPDFVNGNLNADAYNHACKDYKCKYRGRFCSLKPGLKNYEVRTLVALKKGETIEVTAAQLCVSLAGLKSRIEKMKEKLGAKNMASLMARATEFGI